MNAWAVVWLKNADNGTRIRSEILEWLEKKLFKVAPISFKCLKNGSRYAVIVRVHKIIFASCKVHKNADKSSITRNVIPHD